MNDNKNAVHIFSGDYLKIVLLFPGQGAQYPGMCKSLLEDYPFVKKYFDEVSEVLEFDILDLCLNGPAEKLNLTANAQPSILLISYCAFQILRHEYDFKPFLLAGHSLGEISALCCSGAIEFKDAIKIVKKRGEIMQNAASSGAGAMTAINGLSINQVETLLASSGLQKDVVISNINSETQIVISGENTAVQAISLESNKLGAVTIPLKVSAPFHSPMMRPAAKELEKELRLYKYSKLNYPVISNVKSKPYSNENEIIPLLVEQVTAPVNWLNISSYIKRTSANLTLELPPGKTLTKLSKMKGDKQKHYLFNQVKELKLFNKT